jgi:citrate lyase beta subunit
MKSRRRIDVSRRLAFGGGDYTNDLDLEWTSEERELDYARARLTHASRLADIEPPVDTVVIAVKDIERFPGLGTQRATHGLVRQTLYPPRSSRAL